MDKNSLIKFLIKEISQELKKEVRSIIREEFNKLSSSNFSTSINSNKYTDISVGSITTPMYKNENNKSKSYNSLDSLLSGTSPFNSSEMDYGPSVTTENTSIVNSYINEPVIDMDGKVVLPSSDGGNLMNKLLSRNYTPVLKKVEKIK